MSAPDVPPPSWRQRVELLVNPPRQLHAAQVVAAAAGLMVVALLGWFLLRQPPGPPVEDVLPMAAASGSTPSTTAAAELVVHAAGAVRAPGVYRLPDGARVADLLEVAGGPAADADLDRLNLAAPLVDGAQVYVPRQGEAVPSGAWGGSASQPTGPLDLNTATVEQLDALPGVGPATAQAIVAERERRGGFRSVDDLLDVRGIGPAKLEALRDLVTV